ncbi:uncharacterized protein BDCG_00544 [Blastomyces dermatitidis ER-3]|uniref:HTH CENPB-type domain-containing protein n=2 Tax=Ajellomyces dermatitidis TaxID=5039 RepID=F2TAG1_AJEDA|nr:uncharacterized protein BDCG_00544 [Blastomyces dermatitidis ER-3]EEQ83739.2 hypothetical protein BDCG_00544 [Blastomyces dermatitidis ER-3]EGE80224.2 hypothetical protein BDDG_03165 [Blastomyces dermatitidis ATCC 18188]
MDTEAQPQDHDFTAPQWVDMGGGYGQSQHQSPINEFNGFTYGSSPVMPVEPSYSMSIPQPYTSQQLLPLSTPSQWPSMLTTQSTFPPVPLPPMPMPSMPSLHPIHTAPITTAPTPRRTLTDNDRRRMCEYHERHPHVKQTEIGALFGVERSTVSKVLRQKEKYLCPDDGSRSPIKKSKGKFPDIERALSNWVRNHLRQGGQLNDEMIKEKAIFFASTVGGPENHQKILNSNWLEKFKQKNYLRSSQSRKGSIDTINELDSPGNGQANASSQTPNGISPLSPNGTTTPSPLSPKQKSSIKKESIDGALPGYGAEFRQHSHSQSTNSLDRKLSLSASAASSGPIIFSENPFIPESQLRVEQDSVNNSSRPRSQTFPIAVTEPGPVANGSSDHVSPKNVFQPSTSPSVADEDHANTRPSSSESPLMQRNRSNPEIKTNSMQPPPPPQSTTASPVSPSSPTHDEARRALELVLNYFNSQPTGLVAQDYVTIGKLMQKLELAQSQTAGLHRIDEHADGHRVSKKRSIHTL